MNSTNFRLFLFSAVLTIFLAACGEDKRPATEQDVTNLVTTLQQGDFAGFYAKVDGFDQESVRVRLENLDSGKKSGLNYGALVNAQLITSSNRAQFMPDIKKIDYYQDVQNDSRCYMNGTLYNIANSAFFNDFLEIDALLPKKWKNRPSKNKSIADRVIRSLREVIYEIRLGPRTTPDRIAKARERHLEALDNLDDLDTVTNFYHELFTNYDFGKAERIYRNNAGQDRHTVVDGLEIPTGLLPDMNKIRTALSTYKASSVLPGFGHIGPLSRSVASKTGNIDLLYLHGIFIIADPWGASVRYLSVAFKENAVSPSEKPYLQDPYEDKLLFDTSDKEVSMHYFFGDSIFRNDGTYKANYLMTFRYITTKRYIGVLLYRQKANANAPYRLVGKTRGSSNHMIAELRNFKRQEWETHKFFGPGQFNKQESPGGDGFNDYTHFYELLDLP
jgi:hypothetical protein